MKRRENGSHLATISACLKFIQKKVWNKRLMLAFYRYANFIFPTLRNISLFFLGTNLTNGCRLNESKHSISVDTEFSYL